MLQGPHSLDLSRGVSTQELLYLLDVTLLLVGSLRNKLRRCFVTVFKTPTHYQCAYFKVGMK